MWLIGKNRTASLYRPSKVPRNFIFSLELCSRLYRKKNRLLCTKIEAVTLLSSRRLLVKRLSLKDPGYCLANRQEILLFVGISISFANYVYYAQTEMSVVSSVLKSVNLALTHSDVAG